MQLLVNILCFVSGAAITTASLLVWAWYLKLQDRVTRAEAARKEMEDAITAFEEQQKVATAALQQGIADIVKQYRKNSQPQNVSPQMSENNDISLSVKDRIKRAIELTARQSEIDVSKGPEFVMQHNELELEKLAVLKTILADGHDPMITIRFSNGDQQMLLSAYVKSISKGLA